MAEYRTGHVPPFVPAETFDRPQTGYGPQTGDEFTTAQLTDLRAGYDGKDALTEQFGAIPPRAALPEMHDRTEDRSRGPSPAIKRFLGWSLAGATVASFVGVGLYAHGLRDKPACAEVSCGKRPLAAPSPQETDQNIGDITADPTDDPSASASPSIATEAPSKAPPSAATHKSKRPKAAKSAAGGNAVVQTAASCGVWTDMNRQPLVHNSNTIASVVVDTRTRKNGKCEHNGFYDGTPVYNGPSTSSGAKELANTFTTPNDKVINGSVIRVLGLTCNQTQSVKAPNGTDMPTALWLKVDVNGQTGYVSGTTVGYPDQQTLRSMGYAEKYMAGSPTQRGNC